MAGKNLHLLMLVMTAIIAVTAKQEKQIKLEDIESDNLRSEKSHESLQTQQSQHLRPPSLAATNNFIYSNPAEQGKQAYLPPSQHSQQLYLIRPPAHQQQQQQQQRYVYIQQQAAPQPQVQLQYLPQPQPQPQLQPQVQYAPQMYYLQYLPQKQAPVYQQPSLQYSLPQGGIQYVQQAQTYAQPAQEYEEQIQQQQPQQIHYEQQQEHRPIVQYVIQQTPTTHYTQPRQPQSLLDSYVPSYLQLERFRQHDASVEHGILQQGRYESPKNILGATTLLNHIPSSLKVHSQRDVGISVVQNPGRPEAYNTIAYSAEIRPRIHHHKRTINY